MSKVRNLILYKLATMLIVETTKTAMLIITWWYWCNARYALRAFRTAFPSSFRERRWVEVMFPYVFVSSQLMVMEFLDFHDYWSSNSSCDSLRDQCQPPFLPDFRFPKDTLPHSPPQRHRGRRSPQKYFLVIVCHGTHGGLQ